jgi:uncharacterized protein (TIGR03435 family)
MYMSDMSDTNDTTLIQEYADRDSEMAFAELVHRHINLVYSVALRFTGNSQDAQDVAQAVFIILAQKAGSLRQRTTLTGWLYETTRFTARQLLRTRARRHAREQEHYVNSTLNDANTNSVWQQLAPLLEEAMTQLSEKERTLIALRFFERKSAVETAALLGIQEPAARKRVERAVEKLRRFFTKRGVTPTADTLTAAISANSVQAAPAGLVKTISAVAAAKGIAVGGSTLTLVKGALKIMAWTKAKTAIVAGIVAILAAGTTVVVVTALDKASAPVVGQKLSPEDAYLAVQFDGSYRGRVPQALFVRPTHFPLKNMLCVWRGGPLANATGRNVDFAQLLTVAYAFQPSRMVLPPDVPTNHFDFLATLPGCPIEKFQAAIKDTLGWTAHPETRETNVLLLTVKTVGAPGLIPGVATNHSTRWRWGGDVYHATNMPISDLREFLEDEIFHQPVLDQTGLTNNYDIILDWAGAPHPTQNYENSDPLKKVLLEQLGLEPVPARKRIEMLVVEPAKK